MRPHTGFSDFIQFYGDCGISLRILLAGRINFRKVIASNATNSFNTTTAFYFNLSGSASSQDFRGFSDFIQFCGDRGISLWILLARRIDFVMGGPQYHHSSDNRSEGSPNIESKEILARIAPPANGPIRIHFTRCHSSRSFNCCRYPILCDPSRSFEITVAIFTRPGEEGGGAN